MIFLSDRSQSPVNEVLFLRLLSFLRFLLLDLKKYSSDPCDSCVLSVASEQARSRVRNKINERLMANYMAINV